PGPATRVVPMSTSFCGKSLRVVLIAAAMSLLAAAPAFAQVVKDEPAKPADAKKVPVSDYVRPGNLVTAGYVTPGTPMSAKLENFTGKILGGTVYFAVYRHTAKT